MRGVFGQSPEPGSRKQQPGELRGTGRERREKVQKPAWQGLEGGQVCCQGKGTAS